MAENKGKSEVALREEEILAFWEEKEIFKKSLKKDAPKGEFVFYEGPPTANGKPGIHHLESRAFKDAIPRFRTMQGFHVRRKAGWDTHGLPVELEVEKEIGSKNKKDIEAYGIAKFNQKCKESVLRYIDEWQKFTQRIAFWVDHNDTYFTFDNSYIESIWSILQTAHERKLLYKDYKVVPWCPRCGTALSSHEVAQGYQDDTPDPSVYVKFKVKNESATKIGLGGDVYLLAWTTTPWTLPGNVALAVNLETTYRAYQVKSGEYIIAALDRAADIGLEDPNMGLQFTGRNLVGLEYEPLYPYLADSLPAKEKEKLPNAYKVYPANFVSTEDGTGIVHTAVMYGADDFDLGTKVGLPKHHLVGEDGKFTADAQQLAGIFFKDADKLIIADLESCGLMFKAETITHTYPFCWRCKTPLMYYADDSWYIAMSQVKDTLIKENEEIHWEPEHIREGRFGEWLKDLKDWAISRSRFWGTPLPIWECETCKHFEVIGSIADLKEKVGSVPDDLHRPFVDDLSYACGECGGTMKRVPEVLDVWFDSGAMPFAQDHYPFENKEWIDTVGYPADYICEAIDQTRGWFYTLHAVGAGIMNRGKAYKNVICLGHILDAKGKKMSKSVGNIVEPWSMIDRYGVDALRYFMFTVNAPGDSKNFDERLVDEIVKKNIGRLGNVLSFYKLHEGGAPSDESTHILDRWIIARARELVAESTDGFEAYRIDVATRPIARFIDDLSTWYVRRSRDRFKEEGKDKKAAAATLRFVLHTLARVMAPSMPFFAEYLYGQVREHADPESVHLAQWPEKTDVDTAVLEGMAQARAVVSQALEAREKAKIKIRQPLASLTIPKEPALAPEYLTIIADEVNVKSVVPADTKEVALDTKITPELKVEGYVRDVKRLIQDARRELKLSPDQIISKATVILDVEKVEPLEAYVDELKTFARVQEIAIVSRGTQGAEKESVELHR
ncbi:MAG TPA: isoleucine--tRNA ligase [Candidatus Paceibacterota bacterium]|nr:isoleucine--tRNA ligase [Candidatus Paceibacterota bacterium]